MARRRSNDRRRRKQRRQRRQQRRDTPTITGEVGSGQPSQTDAQRRAGEDIAVAGRRGAGTNVGRAREIAGTLVPDAQIIDPGVGRLNQGQQAQFRVQQQALANELYKQATGQAPSLAELQVKNASDRAIAQNQGQVFASLANNPALAATLAARSQAQIAQNASAQGAEARLAEQLQAQQALNSVLQQARGQDINIASADANLAANIALNNARRADAAKQLQAGFQQQANLANQEDFNAFNVQQAEIERALRQAQLAAEAGISQSSIAADASKFGSQVQFDLGTQANLIAAEQNELEAERNSILAGEQAGLTDLEEEERRRQQQQQDIASAAGSAAVASQLV